MRTFQSSVLCVCAAMLVGLAQVFATGAAASALGIPTTVYHYFMAYERVPATVFEAAVILAAPLAASCALGLLGAAVYARTRTDAVRRFWLYLAVFGAMYVLSALAAAGWSGPLYRLTTLAGMPAVFQWSLSATGALVLIVAMWQAGIRLQPPGEAVVIPLLVATAVRVLAYAPAPAAALLMIPAGTAPWLVVIAGSWWEWRRRSDQGARPAWRLWTSVYLLAVLLILIARSLTIGVRMP